MSQLIKLREQIKTIKTIQKITQAMRLVSMSIHSKLNNQKNYLKDYQSELNKIVSIVNNCHENFQKRPLLSSKKLVILIGSQKGLCSSFNQDIWRKFLIYKETHTSFEVVVIGKKLIEIAQRKIKIDYKLVKLTPATISEISDHIFNYINQHNFDQVVCLSNSSKNFFTHITKATQILPLQIDQSDRKFDAPSEPYIWEQSVAEINENLATSQLRLNIYCLLFDSLISEYAARFRSMDKATRNASDLLDTAERQYRKIRQAKITRELVELSAIFQTK